MIIKEISYQGHDIIEISYEENTSKEDLLRSVYQERDIILNSPQKHVLIFSDYRNAVASREIVAAAKQVRSEILKHKTYSKAAIGITGMPRIILKGLNSISNKVKTVAFDKREEALAYLENEAKG